MVTAASGSAAPAWFVTSPETLAPVWAAAAWDMVRKRDRAATAMKKGLTGSPCVCRYLDSMAVREMTTKRESIRLVSICQNDFMRLESTVFGTVENRAASCVVHPTEASEWRNILFANGRNSTDRTAWGRSTH